QGVHRDIHDIPTRRASDLLWSSHVKGKPLRKMATGKGQTRSLNDENKAGQEDITHGDIEAAYEDKSNLIQGKDEFDLLVEDIWLIVQQVCRLCEKNKKPAYRRGGTSCKKGRLRKLSKVWIMMGKSWRKGRQYGYLGNSVDMKMVKEGVQQIV